MAKRSSDQDILSELKELREDALSVIEAKDLYSIWDYVPKADDRSESNKLFSEFEKQGYEYKVYDKWKEAVEKVFKENSLNLLRFKQVTETVDPTKFSTMPASVFLRKYREIDNIVTKKVKLDDYKIDINRPTQWPKVTFEDGIVWQGLVYHQFQEKKYTELISLLWDDRRILDPLGKIKIPGRPISREKIFEKKIAQVSSNGSLGVIRNGIRKAMKAKGINLRLINLDESNVYLEVTHK
jgi:hypothetical protein